MRSTLSLKTVRNQILVWGGFSILVYFVFLIAFPLVPYIYAESRMLDLEIILRNMRRFVWVYIFGLGFLFFAFWRIVRVVHEFSKQKHEASKSLRKWILGFGIISGVILTGLYPITALDVAVYVVNARNWVLYNANPLIVPPENFPDDPYIHLAGEYVDKTSPYGPVWEGMARLPIQLGITDIAGGILAMKIIALLAYLGTAWLIGWQVRQQDTGNAVSEATALAFFALNPFVLLEAIGNGHNDIWMVAFITLGLILWQRGSWAWATFALTLASLIKLPALILLPLFGVTVLMGTNTWRERFLRGLGMAAIFLGVFLSLYRLMGPFPDVFNGILQSFARRSFSPAYALFVIVREIAPDGAGLILAHSRSVFLAIYTFIMLALLRKRLTLLEAGFLSFFALIYTTNAFRIWYPLWLLPFAALNLNSRSFWRTFLFCLAVEFSILSYYILWRWHWRYWEWGLTGPLAAHWDYFKIMTPFTVSWTFTLPFLGDLVIWLQNRKNPKFNYHT